MCANDNLQSKPQVSRSAAFAFVVLFILSLVFFLYQRDVFYRISEEPCSCAESSCVCGHRLKAAIARMKADSQRRRKDSGRVSCDETHTTPKKTNSPSESRDQATPVADLGAKSSSVAESTKKTAVQRKKKLVLFPRFRTHMVVLQRTTPDGAQSELPRSPEKRERPHLLEISSNCNWEPIRGQLLGRMTLVCSTLGDFPPEMTFDIDNYTLRVLPKANKTTPIPPNLQPVLKTKQMFPIRLKVTPAGFADSSQTDCSSPFPSNVRHLEQIQKAPTLAGMLASPVRTHSREQGAQVQQLGISGLKNVSLNLVGASPPPSAPTNVPGAAEQETGCDTQRTGRLTGPDARAFFQQLQAKFPDIRSPFKSDVSFHADSSPEESPKSPGDKTGPAREVPFQFSRALSQEESSDSSGKEKEDLPSAMFSDCFMEGDTKFTPDKQRDELETVSDTDESDNGAEAYSQGEQTVTVTIDEDGGINTSRETDTSSKDTEDSASQDGERVTVTIDEELLDSFTEDTQANFGSQEKRNRKNCVSESTCPPSTRDHDQDPVDKEGKDGTKMPDYGSARDLDNEKHHVESRDEGLDEDEANRVCTALVHSLVTAATGGDRPALCAPEDEESQDSFSGSLPDLRPGSACSSDKTPQCTDEHRSSPEMHDVALLPDLGPDSKTSSSNKKAAETSDSKTDGAEQKEETTTENQWPTSPQSDVSQTVSAQGGTQNDKLPVQNQSNASVSSGPVFTSLATVLPVTNFGSMGIPVVPASENKSPTVTVPVRLGNGTLQLLPISGVPKSGGDTAQQPAVKPAVVKSQPLIPLPGLRLIPVSAVTEKVVNGKALQGLMKDKVAVPVTLLCTGASATQATACPPLNVKPRKVTAESSLPVLQSPTVVSPSVAHTLSHFTPVSVMTNGKLPSVPKPVLQCVSPMQITINVASKQVKTLGNSAVATMVTKPNPESGKFVTLEQAAKNLKRAQSPGQSTKSAFTLQNPKSRKVSGKRGARSNSLDSQCMEPKKCRVVIKVRSTTPPDSTSTSVSVHKKDEIKVRSTTPPDSTSTSVPVHNKDDKTSPEVESA